MKQINIGQFSKNYQVRKLTLEDIPMIFSFCQKNTQYYEYCGKKLTVELIEQDIKICPPSIPLNQKYYVGFFDEHQLIAILDLVDGYPDDYTVFLGFFMMSVHHQGKGLGSKLIQEVLNYASCLGFHRVRLGVDKMNPPAIKFWKKNGFEMMQEIVLEEGIILLAQKSLMKE